MKNKLFFVLVMIFFSCSGPKEKEGKMDSKPVEVKIDSSTYYYVGGYDTVPSSRSLPVTEEKPRRMILFKFYRADKVCVMNKISGVIIDKRGNEHSDTMNVYTVEYIDTAGNIAQGEFYETQLTLGYCPGY